MEHRNTYFGEAVGVVEFGDVNVKLRHTHFFFFSTAFIEEEML